MSELEIAATVHRGEAGEFAASCSILLDLEFRQSALSQAQENDLAILDIMLEPLSSLCQTMLQAGRVLKVDTPEDGPSIRGGVIDDVIGLKQLLLDVSYQLRNELLYPISIWSLQFTTSTETIRSIEAFRLLRMDDALFSDIMRADVVRIAVFRSSVTLSMPCSRLEQVLLWTDSALERSANAVVWIDR